MNQTTVTTNVPFTGLGLLPPLLQGIEAAGFEYCTKIQALALPIVLEGHDVQGQALTGTGKTAAFLLAIMQYLLTRDPLPNRRPNDPRALVLAPTRELAIQIARDAEVLGRFSGLETGVVFGGTGYDSQREMLARGLDILVGTPGRLIDYHRQKIYGLMGIQVVVLDEADRMFDLGFIRDIRYLLRRMPPPERRLNMLFSATLSMRVAELAYEHMNAPQVVNAAPDQVTVDQVNQRLFHVSKDEKISLLLGLLARMDASRSIIFVNTKRVAEKVAAYLKGNGYELAMLTGDVPQKKRLSLLERFKTGQLPILVATDVAARGLHIPKVSHVFNFDLPQDREDYVHRVGRTARAGASGEAISFACEEYVFSLLEIEDYIDRKLPVEAVTPELLVKPKAPIWPARERRPGHSHRRQQHNRTGSRGKARRSPA